jgi:hypothetical protein
VIGWEGIDNRLLPVTGMEPDIDGNGSLDITFETFFENITFDDVFASDVAVVFELDARPAFYFLADSTFLPADTQTGDPLASIRGFYANGPMASPNGWETWGPNDLGQIESLHLVDDGTKGDAVAGDSVFTITFQKLAGQPRKGALKFGVDGYDNESGFGGDHRIVIDPANPKVHLAYGATLKADGTYDDNKGPQGYPQYDPYVLIDNASTPPSFMVVRRGGSEETGTAVDDGLDVPVTSVLHQNYPNPFNPVTTIEFDIAKAGNIRLEVFDLMGRRVALLADGFRTASRYSERFDASRFASGTYIYRLQTPGQTMTKTMILVK